MATVMKEVQYGVGKAVSWKCFTTENPSSFSASEFLNKAVQAASELTLEFWVGATHLSPGAGPGSQAEQGLTLERREGATPLSLGAGPDAPPTAYTFHVTCFLCKSELEQAGSWGLS